MNRPLLLCLVMSMLSVVVVVTDAADRSEAESRVGPFTQQDWPWWRGPSRNGEAAADQNPPLSWSENENVVWKTPIPGRGYGSPTVIGEHVLVATADEKQETRSVFCFERRSGKRLWNTVVHRGDATPPRNRKGSQASSTVAGDGDRYFINFLHDDAMVTSALTLKGELLWQTKITDYVVHQGYGSSPAIYDHLVIVSADTNAGGAIAGLDRRSGKLVWRHDRPETPNYPSPIILHVSGRDQLIMTGCDLVSSFHPLSGEKLWEVEGATTECVTSTVTDGQLVFSSGGYPVNHVSAINADGSGEIVWTNGTRVYVPSMVVKDGYLYAVADAGIAICWKADSGEEVWKARLSGTFSSSPVLVGDRIYVTNEECTTFVFKAQPEKFERLARCQLGDECIATPAICGSRIYARVARQVDGGRHEFLYCIGEQ